MPTSTPLATRIRTPIAIAFLLACTAAAPAQRAEPVWIVRDPPPTPVRVANVAPVLRAAGVLTLTAALTTLAATRRRETDPDEGAFDALAQALGLDEDDRALVRAMATRAHGARPVALLVSEAALRRHLARFRKRRADPGLRAQLNRLEAKLLGGTPRRELPPLA